MTAVERRTATAREAKELRHLIALIISDHKAYKVPAICVRHGLCDGTGEEAFRSKYKYVEHRLEKLSADDIFDVAERLSREESNFDLDEAIAKIREPNQVTELTRKRISESLRSFQIASEKDLVSFLCVHFPLDRLAPPRRDVFGDTFEHYINARFFEENLDNRVLLEAVGFYTCSQKKLFSFLAALVAPILRPDQNEQRMVVSAINGSLALDGYELAEIGSTSGSPLYGVRVLRTNGTPADSGITKALSNFSATGVHEVWGQALQRRSTDPRGAITLARTLLEDTCKWILSEAGAGYADDADLPTLYRLLAKTLKLAPDEYTEKVFRQVLGSCQSIVESLGSIRNKLGDAHSQGPMRAKPQPRHAELAVNLAGAMSTFLVATWEARQASGTIVKSELG